MGKKVRWFDAVQRILSTSEPDREDREDKVIKTIKEMKFIPMYISFSIIFSM
jgi:hypothetical protein